MEVIELLAGAAGVIAAIGACLYSLARPRNEEFTPLESGRRRNG